MEVQNSIIYCMKALTRTRHPGTDPSPLTHTHSSEETVYIVAIGATVGQLGAQRKDAYTFRAVMVRVRDHRWVPALSRYGK